MSKFFHATVDADLIKSLLQGSANDEAKSFLEALDEASVKMKNPKLATKILKGAFNLPASGSAEIANAVDSFVGENTLVVSSDVPSGRFATVTCRAAFLARALATSTAPEAKNVIEALDEATATLAKQRQNVFDPLLNPSSNRTAVLIYGITLPRNGSAPTLTLSR
jgi:hypothetical protein